MNPESRSSGPQISSELNKTKEIVEKPLDFLMDYAFALLGVNKD